ncbi:MULTISPECIES: metallophosphoesterase [Saccharibacillus]|uniref:metallophosphoesterase n=1 Tax=Saccharibacillus TaxID=456492 RepID=UPI0013136760|nr:metallophosphoesterase [Saccharibacillus sp. WB 17]MWJ33422.1 metallophosphoesterase [Saccharibacillus sp. WB 17]
MAIKWGWKQALAAAAGAAAGLGVHMVKEAMAFRVLHEDVHIPGLPAAFDGYRVYFISDIHRRLLPEAEVAALEGKADIVWIGGDLTDRGVPEERTLANMRMLRKIGPSYAVYGNHDYEAYMPNMENLDTLLEASGVKPLGSKNVPLHRGGSTIWLAGIDDLGPAGLWRGDPRIRREDCVLVLMHDPKWVVALRRTSANYAFAGHTHGGQISLPLVGPAASKPFYKTYLDGTHFIESEDGGTTGLRISRGIGTSHFPLRLGSPAETHLLTLRSAPPLQG